jgi:hypothetical protein
MPMVEGFILWNYEGAYRVFDSATFNEFGTFRTLEDAMNFMVMNS